ITFAAASVRNDAGAESGVRLVGSRAGWIDEALDHDGSTAPARRAGVNGVIGVAKFASVVLPFPSIGESDFVVDSADSQETAVIVGIARYDQDLWAIAGTVKRGGVGIVGIDFEVIYIVSPVEICIGVRRWV